MKIATDELKAVTVILRTSQAIQEVIRKDVSNYGLNPTEFSVIELLYHKGDQPTQMIGKKVLLTSGSITYVVDKLVNKNYVIRKACPKDRRVTYAALTDSGMDLMNRIFPEHKLIMEKVFDQLEADEINETIEMLKRIGHRAKSL
ncbi:MarR family transcriptional regulator [Sporosarcina sp. Marseille-Q4063]|uniref:MarR family winged helix-turn-helix transcriptional regulator n=1 Tax=Sporosarcina sp. Marseille-Q4063 TaxID=2810514 RepID=UPI001BAFB22D|nr:MarR family transcriptional regulator [Sporosarcina sp. Marseille-Q4063]QUW22902.1 MarR family transcriptional regulator [Sporosarcina sp. Marseille-Q4063]